MKSNVSLNYVTRMVTEEYGIRFKEKIYSVIRREFKTPKSTNVTYEVKTDRGVPVGFWTKTYKGVVASVERFRKRKQRNG